MTTNELMGCDHSTFKTYVMEELSEGHGQIRPDMVAHLDDKRFVQRLWLVLFELVHDYDRTNERSDPAKSLISRIATEELLLSLDERDFQIVVDDEVRRSSPTRLRHLLSSPALIRRWQLALIYIKKSVEQQMGTRADEVLVLLNRINSPHQNRDEERLGLHGRALRAHRIEAHRAAQEKMAYWRAGAKRFKLWVEERLLEIDKIELAREGTVDSSTLLLVKAIERHHRKVITEHGADLSPADRELWDVLTSLRERISA